MKSSQDKIREIKELVNSYKKSHLIMTANRLGIFKVVKAESILLKNISIKLNINVDRIEPLLNALVFYNILSKNDKGYFLDYYKEVLNPDEELNQLGYITFAKTSMDKWNDLEEVIKNPGLAANNFNELTTETAKDFILGMNTNAISQAKFLTQNYNFDNHNIIDIGAGAGTYIIEIVKNYKNVKAKAVDLPEMAKILKNIIRNEKLDNQIDVLSLDFNSGLPKGEYDDAFLFAIVHMENEDNVQKLLRNIYNLLKPKGRLFLTSFFLNEDKVSPEFSVIFAVQMLINSVSGRTYTHNEINEQIKKAGFSKVDRIDEIPGYATLYIAEK